MKLVLAPAVWLAHFTFAYVVLSLVCSVHVVQREWLGVGLVPLAVGAATVIACALFAAIGYTDYRAWRRLENGPRELISIVSVLSCALSALGVLWVAYPAFVLPACAT